MQNSIPTHAPGARPAPGQPVANLSSPRRNPSRTGPGERLARLRADVMAREGPLPDTPHYRRGSWVPNANPFTRNVALFRSWQPGMSLVEAGAATLLELVRLTEVAIFADWRLAGEHMHGMHFGDPERNERHRAQRHRFGELGVDEADVPKVIECMRLWHRTTRQDCHSVGRPLFDAAPEQANDKGMAVYLARGWIANHSVRDYAKVLRVGYRGVGREIQAKLECADMADPDFVRAEAFWHAGLMVCEAGCLLGKRYAQCAAHMAENAKTAEEKDRLTRMAATCARVPAEGAQTLFEATQALWFAHILTCGEDTINANSIGRLDQILAPYYQADVAAGRITRDEALELMEELACKLYLEYDVQAITLAGRTADGSDATNEMTYLVLEASRNLEVIRDVSVRLHRDSPDPLVELCARLIADGGGIPFLFNDECFIPALHEHGIALADARNYAPIGCIELTVPGKANPHAVSGWFHATKCLELALFDGIDPVSGKQLGPKTGDLTSFTSYDELWQAYRTQVEHFAKRMVYHCNRGELKQRECGPLPCWSILTDDCIERGRDITDGGPVYNYHSICFLGTANTADSLCALRKLVFEEHKIAPAVLLDALRADFARHEPLRQLLLNGAPKYGNDIDEVDALAAQVADHFIDLMDLARSPLDGRYFVHLFSFLLNLGFGKGLGATPDGRRAGEPIAYSLSAQQGRDEKGVTAMLRSLAKLPHNRAAGASAAIVDLDPQLVEGEAGIQRLTHLLRAAISLGVGQLQMNVTTVERLRLAQRDPETYGNIPVRVAGYSQLFRLVAPELQEHIIARTKHRR